MEIFLQILDDVDDLVIGLAHSRRMRLGLYGAVLGTLALAVSLVVIAA